MHHRRAFSLIELLTALVLLAVGLAASVRAAAGVARLENDTRLRRALAEALQARLDSLLVEPCATALAGEARHAGITERWSAVGDGGRWIVVDSFSVPGRLAQARSYTLSVACRP